MSDNEDNQPKKKQKMSFSEIPNWKSSHDEKELLSKKFVLCKNFQLFTFSYKSRINR